MVSPCCCMSLQRGVSVLAIIDAVLNGIALVLLGLGVAAIIAVNPDDHDEITKENKIIAIVFVVLAIISCVFQMTLALYLRKGAKTKDQRICFIWLVITGVLLVFTAIDIGRQAYQANKNISGIISSILIGILYKLYEIWVVISFRNEIFRNENISQFADVKI